MTTNREWRQRPRVCRRGVRAAGLGVLLLVGAGCADHAGAKFGERQEAASVRTADPTSEGTVIFAEQQPSEARAESSNAARVAAQRALAENRREMDAHLAKMHSALAEQRQAMAELERRVRAAEASLAELTEHDVAATEAAATACARELKQLKGDQVGFAYRTQQRFEDIALIHANLEQADDDVRKQVATSVTQLERRGTKARDALEQRLSDRIAEERNALVSSYRELERQTAADRSRVALAMQAVREAISSQQDSVRSHSENLDQAVRELDVRFGAGGDAGREREASAAFDEARRLHREYLDARHRPELLAEAIEAYRRGLALRPEATEMHYELARLLRVARQANDAEPHLKYYVHHGSDPERVVQARAWLNE
jgi:hypothetical protein